MYMVSRGGLLKRKRPTIYADDDAKQRESSVIAMGNKRRRNSNNSTNKSIKERRYRLAAKRRERMGTEDFVCGGGGCMYLYLVRRLPVEAGSVGRLDSQANSEDVPSATRVPVARDQPRNATVRIHSRREEK